MSLGVSFKPWLIRETLLVLLLSGVQSAASHTHTHGRVSQNYTAAKGRVHPWNEPESVDENNNYRLKVSPLTAPVSLSSSAGGFQGSGWAEESLLRFLFGSSCPPPAHPQNPEQFVLLLRRSSLCKQYFLGGWLGVGLGEGPLLNLQHTETNKQLRIINSVALSSKHGWRPGRGEDWRTAEILRGCFAGECQGRRQNREMFSHEAGRRKRKVGGGWGGRF